MKKLIVAIIAAFMMSFAGTAAYAAYEPTTDTNVKPETNDENPEPGEKVRFIVKPRVQGDTGQCTGTIIAVYKGGADVLKQRDKAVGNRVAFNGRIPAGATKIIFIYQRGKKDPCDKSRSAINV